MRCPACNHRLIQKSGDKLKLRVPILVFSDDGTSCSTNCPECKKEIQIPITLAKSAIPDEPALVIQRGRLPPKQIQALPTDKPPA